MALRIQFWVPPLVPVSGGNLYDRTLVEGLAARGHEVVIREFPPGTDPPTNPETAAEVVIQDELLHREFLRVNLSRSGPRPRILALVHHLQSSEPEREDLEIRRLAERERAYLGTVDGVLGPSRASVEAAIRLAGKTLPGAVVSPGGDRFAGGPMPRPLPRPEEIRARAAGPLRAAFVGNLIPRKRLLELLDAIAAVPEWTLAVAGREDADPEYARRAHRRAAAPDLDGRVFFRGVLGPEALAALLRQCSLLAVPSTHEGFGLVYLEGFAFGLPALAAASGGVAELVKDGATGWRIHGGESRLAARRIARFLRILGADRGLLAAMGIRARDRHRSHPAWAESLRAAERFLTSA